MARGLLRLDGEKVNANQGIRLIKDTFVATHIYWAYVAGALPHEIEPNQPLILCSPLLSLVFCPIPAVKPIVSPLLPKREQQRR